MRFSKFGALAILSGALVLGSASACEVVDNATAETKAVAHEGYRATLVNTVSSMGFTGVTAVIEEETEKAASPASGAKTTKVIELLADVPGTHCKVNVEQQLEPQFGQPYAAEIVLPGTLDANGKVVKPGKEIDIATAQKPALTMLDIFNYTHGVAGCAIPGVTTPTLVMPSASGMASLGANPAATS